MLSARDRLEHHWGQPQGTIAFGRVTPSGPRAVSRHASGGSRGCLRLGFRPPTFLPALRICTFEALRTEAVMFAEHRPDKSVHMVLRLPGKVYADCDVSPSGTAKLVRRSKDKELLPQEQGTMLTLFPGAPPREPCYKSEHAVDSEGNPFGWISRKGC